MQTIIRGGQLSLHAIRMFGQVAGAIIKWSVLVYLISVILLMLPHTDTMLLESILTLALAHIYNDMGFGESIISIYGSANTAHAIANDYIINLLVDKYFQLLAQKALLGLGVVSCIALVAIILFSRKGITSSKKTNLRGASLVKHKELNNQIKKYNLKHKHKNHLNIAGIPYPKYGETQHTLVTGSTGSGKTVVISDLVEQIQNKGGKAIIYDKMGNFVEKFYNPERDIILNPFDDRTKCWSVFDEVEMAANFDSIAAAFIPLERDNSSEFWVKAARTIFSSVCSKVFDQGQKLSNYQLVKILMKQALSEVSKIVKDTPAASILSPDSPKTALSVMSIISTYLKPLQYLQDDGEAFSIRDWILDENKNGLIFLTSKGNLHKSLEPLISAWIEIALTSILSLDRSTKRRIWMIIDELPSLYQLPSLEIGLAEVRQFGGCFVLGVQSKTQLASRYGRNVSETINSLCGTKIHLRTPDEETSRWCSSNLGKEEVEEVHEGKSFGAHQMRDGVSLNTQKKEKVLVMPSQISSLENLAGYIKPIGSFPIAKFKMKYKDREDIAKHFIKSSQIEEIAKKMSAVEEDALSQAKEIANNNAHIDKKRKRLKEDAQIEALKVKDESQEDEATITAKDSGDNDNTNHKKTSVSDGSWT